MMCPAMKPTLDHIAIAVRSLDAAKIYQDLGLDVAGAAPGRPEVVDHHLAAQVAGAERAAGQRGEPEVRQRLPVALRGRRLAAPAGAAGEGESDQAGRSETGEARVQSR